MSRFTGKRKLSKKKGLLPLVPFVSYVNQKSCISLMSVNFSNFSLTFISCHVISGKFFEALLQICFCWVTTPVLEPQ